MGLVVGELQVSGRKYGEMIFEKNYFENPIFGPSCEFVQVQKEKTFQAFSILCNREGIRFTGYMEGSISSTKELQEFARLTADAWKEYLRFKPKLFKPGPDGELLS